MCIVPDVLPTCICPVGRADREAPEVSTLTLPWNQKAWGNRLGLDPTGLRQALVCVEQAKFPRAASRPECSCKRPTVSAPHAVPRSGPLSRAPTVTGGRHDSRARLLRPPRAACGTGSSGCQSPWPPRAAGGGPGPLGPEHLARLAHPRSRQSVVSAQAQSKPSPGSPGDDGDTGQLGLAQGTWRVRRTWEAGVQSWCRPESSVLPNRPLCSAATGSHTPGMIPLPGEGVPFFFNLFFILIGG